MDAASYPSGLPTTSPTTSTVHRLAHLCLRASFLLFHGAGTYLFLRRMDLGLSGIDPIPGPCPIPCTCPIPPTTDGSQCTRFVRGLSVHQRRSHAAPSPAARAPACALRTARCTFCTYSNTLLRWPDRVARRLASELKTKSCTAALRTFSSSSGSDQPSVGSRSGCVAASSASSSYSTGQFMR